MENKDLLDLKTEVEVEEKLKEKLKSELSLEYDIRVFRNRTLSFYFGDFEIELKPTNDKHFKIYYNFEATYNKNISPHQILNNLDDGIYPYKDDIEVILGWIPKILDLYKELLQEVDKR